MSVLCQVLQVSRSGFYAWCRRRRPLRAQEDARLTHQIREIHASSRRTYGSPRIHHELQCRKVAVGRKRVMRLMREAGIVVSRPRPFKRTTDSDHGLPVATNVLNRCFDVEEPDRAWVTDITYIRTWEGWLYLAVILDLFSRRVVGWSMATHMKTDLVLSALAMALGQRVASPELVHHSDRGGQYAADIYQDLLEKRGIVCSMSRRGDCWDNAPAESWFSTLKLELIYRRPWPTRRGARSAIHEYIGFYNQRRKHSYLNYLSPVRYEEEYHRQADLAA